MTEAEPFQRSETETIAAPPSGARVSELALLRWENLHFERDFVEVATKKIRTKVRSLVPLRARLLSYRQVNGPRIDYADPRSAFIHALAGTSAQLQGNGFRHSYITYRLAEINDTARGALK